MNIVLRLPIAIFCSSSVFLTAATAVAASSSADKQNPMMKSNQKSKQKTNAKPAAKVASKASGVKKSDAAPENKPALFIAARAQKVVTALMRRPVRSNENVKSEPITAPANKVDWLTAVYSKNLVESSWATEMLSDKRILAEIFDRELGAEARAFYPKTMGLREFLVKHQLVNKKGVISASGDEIDDALYSEFPAGYVVHPAVGIAAQEKGRGLYPDSDNFVVELLKDGSSLYSPSHMRQAIKSHILEAVASGEAVVLQEDIMRAADAKKPLRHHYYNEVRIHTYENRVVEGAVPARWVQTNLLSADQIQKAEIRVGELLKALPLELLNRQAWGVDVAVLDNGEMRIVDIITNRGMEIPWSGYLDQPRVIGAYTRHFEQYYGVQFQGLSGTLIRHNFANYMPFWERRIEKAKPGWNKALAYLPPMP